MRRVRHSRRELSALAMLNRIIMRVLDDQADHPAEMALLESAVIALKYYYESDRERVLRETWSVLRSL